MTILFNYALLSDSVGIIAAVTFFLVGLTVAYLAFRLLKKMVKMMVRLSIVGIILAIAVAGSIAFLALGTGKSTKPPSSPTRPR